jgi:type IV pilus assembly protein PilQ
MKTDKHSLHAALSWTGKVLFILSLLCMPFSLYALEIETIYKNSERIGGQGDLSLSIQDADIQSVLKAVAQQRDINIVAAPDVKGTVSVHLTDASLQEVLDSVIRVNGFNYSRQGDIIFVTNPKGQAERDLSGTEVRTFKLNYVSYDDIEEMKTNVKDMLSPSAMVTLYKPEKTLIIEDIPHYLDRVAKVLKQIDVPPKQVLIEARILEIRLNDDTALGIDWNYMFNHSETTGNFLTKGFAGRSDALGFPQGLFFSAVDDNFQLFLDALQVQTEVNTLSTPKLMALDNEEAKIIVGEKLGYFVTVATDTTVLQTVEFLEVGTQLSLIPYIMSDGNIIMDIHPEVSDGTVTAGLPSETTTEVTTTMIARDGGTIFIGGLIRDRKEDIRDQVPGLGCLPILGLLFGRSTNATQKTEIVVLITPRVISPAETDRFRPEIRKVEDTKKVLDEERSLREVVPGLN